MTAPDPWTWEHLRLVLAELQPPITLSEPAAQLRELESYAHTHPADRALHWAVLQARRALTVDADLPTAVAGVHRERLLCWDGGTATWSGRDTLTGLPARVRVVTLGAGEPWRRALARDGEALAPLLPGLRTDADALAIVLAPGGEEPPPLRAFAQAMSSVERWTAAGLGVPETHPEPLAVLEGGLGLVSLTPGSPATETAIRAAAAWLGERRPGDDPLVARLASWSPDDIGETRDALRTFLAQDLTARWRTLERAERSQARRGRHERLRQAVHDLWNSLPPPAGRSAIGVDLQGRVEVLTSAGGQLSCGPVGDERWVAGPEGVDKALARHILRTRATRPPGPGLQRQVDGDDDELELMTSWLASAARLQTLRVLLRR